MTKISQTKMPSREVGIEFFFTNSPSSAQTVRMYASNVSQPLRSRLTPLRLTYYAYLLVASIRLSLNTFFRGSYNQYDLTMYLFDHYATHHMAGLVLVAVLSMAFAFDYVLGVRANRKVAPMLLDLLKCDGKFKKCKNDKKEVTTF